MKVLEDILVAVARWRPTQIAILLAVIFLVGRGLLSHLFGTSEPQVGASTIQKEIVGKDFVEVATLKKELGEQQARIDELNNEIWKLKNINGPWKNLSPAGEVPPVSEIVNSAKELKTALEELKKAIPKKEEEPAEAKKDLPAKASVDAESLHQVLSQRLSGDSQTKISALRWLREKSKEKPELVSPEVARLLVELLSDKAEPIQREVESLLLEASRKNGVSTKKELVSYMLEQDKKKAEKPALLLIKIGNSAIPELTEALGTADREKLKKIGWCLKKIGPEAIQSLQEVYEEGSVSASMAANEILQAIPPLKTQ